MRNRRHIFFAFLIAAVATSVAAFYRSAPAHAGDDNAAVAINTRDGSSVFRVRLAVTRENGDVVDASNAAVAFASCTDCQTTAIAFQAILVSGSPSLFEPSNMAIAINEGCSGCTTLADAVQYVVQKTGQVHFTAVGNQQLAQIRRDLEALRHADQSYQELASRLDELSAAFADVLAHDVVVVGRNSA